MKLKLRTIAAPLLVILLYAASSARAEGQLHPLPDQAVLTQLPNKEIRALAADRDGYVWIGTTHGLFRFSGNCYIPYLRVQEGGLSSDNIVSLLCDEGNRLWVGTEYGINRIEDGKVTLSSARNYNIISALAPFDQEHLFYSGYNTIGLIDKESGDYVRIKPSSFLSEALRAKATGSGDILLIDKNAEMLYRLDRDLEPCGHFSPGKGNIVNDMLELDGKLYIATRSGLRVFDPFLREEKPLPRGLSDLSGRNIIFLEADEGFLYLGVSETGILRMNRQDGAVSLLTEPDSMENTYWGLGLLSGNHFFVSPNGYDLQVLGTSVDRLFRIPLRSRRNQVSKLLATREGNVLCVTSESLLLLDRENGYSVDLHPDVPELEGMNVVHLSPDNRLLILRAGILYAFQLEGARLTATGRLEVPSYLGCWFDTQRSIFRIRNGNLLLEWDGSSAANPIGEMDATDFLDTFPARNGTVYFTDYRSTIYQFRNGQMQALPCQVPFPLSVDADRKGGLWIGSGSDGLFRYDLADGTLQHHPLPDESVSQVEVDDDDAVWVCMRNSVLRIDGKDGRETLYRNPNHEAMVYTGTATAKTRDGVIYFGGKDYIQEMKPDSETVQSAVPVFITAITINGQTVPESTDLQRLGYKENSLSFYYTALCYDFYETLNFAYRLDGFDKDWVFTSEDNRVRYSNLPPGRYTFRIKVQGPDGVWNEQEARESFRIRPAWWMTDAFKAGLLLLLLGLAAFIGYNLVQRRLSRERLRFAQQEKKLSEALNQEKLDLFTNLSHELRTPLSLIYGPVRELSRNPALRAAEGKKLSLIENNTERLLDITEQIIQFNNPTDASRLKLTRTDLARVIRSIASNFSLVAEEAAQELTVDAPDTLEAWCDLDKVEKMVFNLLTNALRYTPTGGKIAVRLGLLPFDHAQGLYRLQEASEGNYVEIQVRDSGPGIDPGKMETVFERYRRLNPKEAVKPQDKGFGIGLNYVIWLVKLHKGDIKAANNPGGGACMSIAIPVDESAYPGEILLPGPETERSLDQVHAVPTPLELPEGEDLTLLLVEDDESLRTYLQEMLSGQFKVVCAQDGAEATRILKLFVPDILVSDIYMPYKDGFTLCEEVKASPECCHVPVVLLTALSTYENQVQGLKVRADAFVAKPFDPEYLKLVLANLLDNRRRLQRSLTGAGSTEGETELNPLDREFMEKLYVIIDEHLSEEDFNITALGKELGMSRTSFYSKVKGLFGETPQNFLTTYRLNKAMELLKSKRFTVSEAAWKVGFGSLAGFSKSFKKQFGIPPSQV